MYKYILLIFALSFSAESMASDLKVIKYDKKNDTYQTYLFGSQKGRYIIKSWQYDISKIWNGKGNPDLNIENAVNIAKTYLKVKNKIILKTITLRSSSYSKNGHTIWFYFIEFSTPYKFNHREYREYESLVLTSGEIVAPYN